VGGRITNYLLEKSRVVQPAVNERSFHIFYQLIAGSKDSERRQLNLDSADKFQYLRQVWWPCRCSRCCMAAHTRIAGAPVVELFYGGCSQRQRVVQGDRRRYSTSRCIVLPTTDCTAVCVHADWRIFRCAGMAAMGMTPEEISQVFRIVSAVLWLGQVELHADQEKYALSAMPGSDCRRALLTTRL